MAMETGRNDDRHQGRDHGAEHQQEDEQCYRNGDGLTRLRGFLSYLLKIHRSGGLAGNQNLEIALVIGVKDGVADITDVVARSGDVYCHGERDDGSPAVRRDQRLITGQVIVHPPPPRRRRPQAEEDAKDPFHVLLERLIVDG